MKQDNFKEIAENLYFVFGEGRGLFPYSHSLLLKGKETVLIDAGIGEARIREIDENTPIDILIISHSHPDHIRYWHLFEDRHILMPRETPEVISDLELLGDRFTGTAERGAYWAKAIGEALGIRPMRAPDARYSDGDLLDFGGGHVLQAIHAPGHVDDHYCFLHTATGTLFTTDIDLTPFGPWYGNPESAIEQFADSTKMIMNVPYQRVCTSHRPPIEGDATGEFEAFLAVFDRHRQRILDLCRPPRTLEQIAAASPFYEDRLPEKMIQKIFEENMAEKQLDLLIRDGLVQESDGLYSRIDNRYHSSFDP